MTHADIAQVTAIERESFPTTWPRTAYRREMANKNARYLVAADLDQPPVEPEPEPEPEPKGGLLGLLKRAARTNEADGVRPQAAEYLIGYIGTWTMVDELHIVSIAVRQAFRGRGVGELLLAEAVDQALADGQEMVTLEVRRSNLAAQALYEKFRFLKVGVRARYYSDNNEDAVIMSTPPIQAYSYREHVHYLREQRLAKATGSAT